MKTIIKGSDRILKIRARKEVGLFKFSDSNLVNFTCILYDADLTQIGSYSKTGNTIVPVTISYDDNGNEQQTASQDTDIFLIYLLKTATTSSNATGNIKAKFIYKWNNTNFTDDNTYDPIDIVITDYYLKPNV